MSHKRPQPDEGAAGDDKGSRKSHSFRRVAMDVINLQRLQRFMCPVLEPLIRRVVKEEVDSALTKYINSMRRNSERDARPSESRRLQLQFINAISLPVFTGTRIEGEGCSPVEISLIDLHSGEIISSGVGSCARVEIVVLEGDFDGNDGDNWTLEEFTGNIVREREGKKPLLTGDLIVTLKDGIGLVGDLSFTDNSSWTRSRKFRLGARVMDDIEGIRIREAKSEPFVVRDHRGELYKKHHPPSLSDEVWRLEKIGKDGALHRRLTKDGIHTVQDFLILLSLNPTRLRNILGSGMSSKKWEVTVEHARTCVLDNTLCLYTASTSLQKDGVVFNPVGQVRGMFLDGQYVVVDQLTELERANAHELVISAYAHRDKIVTLDETDLAMPNQPNSNMFSEDLSSHKMATTNYPQVDPSVDVMHQLYPTGGPTSFDYCNVDPVELRCDQPLNFTSQATSASYFGIDALPGTTFSMSDNMNFEEFSGDFFGILNNSPVPCPAPEKCCLKRWGVLVWVLRWTFSIKRIVARKSNRVRALP